jgi:DNA-binding transcriptional regulator GbsR (MarR family)
MDKKYFYIIPAELVEKGELTKAMLLGVIKTLKNKDGFCWASNQFLANKLNRKDKSVISKYVKELENEEYVRCEHSNGKKRKIYPLEKSYGFKELKTDPLEKTEAPIGKNLRDPLEKTEESNISIVTSNEYNISDFEKSDIKEFTCTVKKLTDKRKYKKKWCVSICTQFCPNDEKFCMDLYKKTKKKFDDYLLAANICNDRTMIWEFCRSEGARASSLFKAFMTNYKERDPGGLADEIRRLRNKPVKW